MISIEELKTHAKNLMFGMKEEEYNTLQKEFETFICWMKYIDEIKGLNEVEPLYFPFDLGNAELRADVPIKSLNKVEALKNAKELNNGSVIIPRVVEE